MMRIGLFYLILPFAKLWELLVRGGYAVIPSAFAWVFRGTRFLRSETARIGHIAIEPDMLVKQIELGALPRANYHLVARPDRIANRCLLDYWKPHLRIHDTPLSWAFWHPFSRIRALGVELNKLVIAEGSTSGWSKIQNEWGERPALLTLYPEHEQLGDAWLRSKGVPEGAWWVCFHTREPGYLSNEKYGDDYRNASIESYLLAMQYVVSQGGWAIRMGDLSAQPLPSLPQVIDYAVASDKADVLDVFLSARCRVFIGCTSGMALVASVFGRPVGQTNAVPLSAILFYNRFDKSIPKLYREMGSQTILPFHQVFGSPLANLRRTEEFAAVGIELVANSPEDILELTEELLAAEQGTASLDSQGVELEKRFLSLMSEGDYSYQSPAGVGHAFLKRYQYLL